MVNDDSLQERRKKNVETLYNYTKQSVNDLDDSIKSLDAKLSAIIGFDALIIRLAKELPVDSISINLGDDMANLDCYSCYLLKVAVYVGLFISLFIAIRGLLPQSRGEAYFPSDLLDQSYLDQPEDEFSKILIRNWDATIQQEIKFRENKSKRLEYSIRSFALSAGCAALELSLNQFINFLAN